MKPEDVWLALEARMRRHDLSPAQCRAARGFLGWDVYDLADASGLEVDDICSFEAGGLATANLTLPERFRLWKAFRRAGVIIHQTKNGQGVRIHHQPKPSVPPTEEWDNWASPHASGFQFRETDDDAEG